MAKSKKKKANSVRSNVSWYDLQRIFGPHVKDVLDAETKINLNPYMDQIHYFDEMVFKGVFGFYRAEFYTMTGLESMHITKDQLFKFMNPLAVEYYRKAVRDVSQTFMEKGLQYAFEVMDKYRDASPFNPYYSKHAIYIAPMRRDIEGVNPITLQYLSDLFM